MTKKTFLKKLLGSDNQMTDRNGNSSTQKEQKMPSVMWAVAIIFAWLMAMAMHLIFCTEF